MVTNDLRNRLFCYLQPRIFGVVLMTVVGVAYLFATEMFFLASGKRFPLKPGLLMLWVLATWAVRLDSRASYGLGGLLCGLSLPVLFAGDEFLANQLCVLAFMLWLVGLTQDLWQSLINRE